MASLHESTSLDFAQAVNPLHIPPLFCYQTGSTASSPSTGVWTFFAGVLVNPKGIAQQSPGLRGTRYPG
jgi:hypothetical protein